MTKRQGLRAIIFLLILLTVLWIAGTVVGMPRTDDVVLMTRRFDALYTDEKDTWDGIVIGVSTVDRAWAAPLAWEKYGMAVYPMATDGQPFFLSTDLIREVKKYQDISFVMVDLQGTRPGALKSNGSRVRWITDHMKPSLDRIKTVAKALNYMDTWYPGAYDESFVNRLSYYIPFLKFHSRITAEDFYEWDFIPGKSEMKGAYEAARHIAANPVDLQPSDSYTELTEQQLELFEELFAYAEETGLQLVFVNPPSVRGKEVLGYINAAAQYVQEQGYPVLNFNDADVLEESGINGTDDFIDKKHMNTSGAYKFTQFVSDWLHETVEIPDHRGETGYESWDEAWEVYEEFYEQSLIEIEEWKEICL